jgi:23S rRNA (uracil1939-C5)-methyltransferase
MMPQLTVEWILPDGRTGGPAPKKADFRSFRVRGPLPGARIASVDGRRRGRTLDLSEYDLVAPSPHRIPHPCPVQGTCGGCDLGALATDVRLEHLARMVQRALRLDDPPPVTRSDRRLRHRSRVRLAVDGARIGYHEARSHDVVDIEDCLAADEALMPLLRTLRGLLPIEGLRAAELATDGTRAVAWLEGRVDSASVSELGHVAIDGRGVAGDPTLTLGVQGPAGPLSLRVSPRSFTQVNAGINQLLVDWVVDRVRAASPERIVDLYAGIGNLTLPLAQLGVPVAAVELEGQATADLRFNAEQNGVHVAVHTGRVERFDLAQVPFDVAVLDPPRAGAGNAMERVLLHRPRRIVLISCHVPSAARDVRPALEAGYRLTEVRVFEMFVDTHHVETAIVLDRG